MKQSDHASRHTKIPHVSRRIGATFLGSATHISLFIAIIGICLLGPPTLGDQIVWRGGTCWQNSCDVDAWCGAPFPAAGPCYPVYIPNSRTDSAVFGYDGTFECGTTGKVAT